VKSLLISAPESPEEWEKKRQFIVEFSKWENSLNRQIIEKARSDILQKDGRKVLIRMRGGS